MNYVAMVFIGERFKAMLLDGSALNVLILEINSPTGRYYLNKIPNLPYRFPLPPRHKLFRLRQFR